MIKENAFLIWISLIFLLKDSSAYYIPTGSHSNVTLDNLTFGSCFYGRESERFDMFKVVLQNNPQLWMWIGDAAYVDEPTMKFWASSIDVNFTNVRNIFNESRENKYYQILHEKIPTIGIWDDHDFALNDGDGHFKHKETAKQIYLDFIDEPRNSERRILDRGIFTTYSFGDPQTHKTVRIIFLDVRYNKTSAFWDSNADILGEDQWKWFEDVLVNNEETFTLIVAGTQILPFNRFLLFETWYGRSRARLFDLLGRVGKSGVVLLTGDVHCAQILKTFCVLPKLGYNLFEITSSGLSHYDRIHFLLDYFMPNDYNMLPTINYYNFAKIDFIWGDRKEDAKMDISIIDIDNITRVKFSLGLMNDLTFDKSKITDPYCEAKLNSKYKSIGEYFSYYYNNKWMIFILLIYHTIFIGILGLFMFIIMALKWIYRKIVKFFTLLYIYIIKEKIKH